MTVGRVHSMESMGLVDGPGIRTVIFFQGCSLRCRFCHNPDTWEFSSGEITDPETLVKKISRFKPYFKNTGGVTFSGGEPLMQPDFLLETLKLCKQENIHTCIDTAGYGMGSYDEILEYTDLVLLDLKHVSETDYKQMTGRTMDRFQEFLSALEKSETPIWIRHVVVPGITDSQEHMENLKTYISTIPNVEKVELLPYHLLGKNKYEVMGIPYSLDGVPAMDKEKTMDLQSKYFGGYDHA
ncbi:MULTISPECIES: pyruvate formate-lyase-activating protein [Anaerostipes]|uniref:pyruvate formate-lyase-activating protein n=1 Tax=Anaerostipes TaxID=207244 RepID=UPI000952629D|nr:MULTISPECIES: pyruvate formate-lyase-activating protein [unclassified Anaerostipes]MCI5623193.1 pyruvate formate-lyase-activating protein [Anaerostipes sp.]MDY2726812.1 pyruvate formate-lyase-activating protein [Anaerostipes faecalis]OLR59626.1 pyruvate formate-lyase 1-activating enzyme [Anaerostipes sp. 494a]